MKQTQITELLANIRATAVSFFSIAMFVALGVGVFTGITWSGDALYQAADTMYRASNFHHFQVQFPYGLNEDDLGELQKVDGVKSVEGCYASFQEARADNTHFVVKMQSLPNAIDALEVVEGELPKSSDQIAVLYQVAEQNNIALGSTVSLEHDAGPSPSLPTETDGASGNTSGMQFLVNDSFTVTALVKSPEYTNTNNEAFGYSNIGSGAIDCVCYTTTEAFDASAFHNAYPLVNVVADIPVDLSTFSDEYKARSLQIENRIEAIAVTQANKRTKELHDAAQKAVDEGQEQVDEGQQKIDEGQQKINEGKAQISEGEKQLEEGQHQLADSETQVSSGEAQLAAAEEQLELQKAKGEAQLASAKAQLDSGRAQLDLARAQADAAAAQLELLDHLLSCIDMLEDRAGAFANAALEYEQTLNGMVQDGRLDAQSYRALLDAYGAEIGASLQTLAAISGIGGIEIPTISSANFTSDVSALQNDFPNKIEEATLSYNGETLSVAQLRARANEGRQQLEQSRADIAAGEEELAAKQAEYDAAVAESQEQLEAAQAELDDKHQQLESAKSSIASGKEELEANKEKLEEAKDELAEKTEQLEAGKDQLGEAKSRLEAGREQLASVKDYTWTVLPRAYNGGVTEADVLASVTRNLSLSMAMLFVIVGLLVSYSAISRIVHEQVLQIGTKKALGLRGKEITASFMAYSTLAVVAGAAIGLTVGVLFVERIIGGTLGQRFCFGTYPPYFSAAMALGITLLELVLILATTWFACHSILQRQAVDLLRGEKPPTGRQRFFEKWDVWNKLPTYTQTIVNNCFNDKRRVFSTIVGVAGCTALIVTAITLNDDVLSSYDRHYEEVYSFDTIVYLESDVSSDNVTRIVGALEEGNMPCAQVNRRRSALTLPNGESSTIMLVTPINNQDFSERYHVIPLADTQPDLSKDELWLTQAYSVHFGAKPGDSLEIDIGDGMLHEIPVTGFERFWLTFHEAVVSPSLYAKEFGAEPTTNAIYLDSNGRTPEEIASVVSGLDGIFSIDNNAAYEKRNFNAFSNVSRSVVAIYLALAVVMAIVVLLNLNIMFINEKKRELIVLMINGFSVHDAKRYIYNDTIVLTIIGTILGAVLGAIMGSVTVGSIEPNTAVMVKDIVWRAVAIGIAGSAILSFAMSTVALRRVPQFSLTDINRF